MRKRGKKYKKVVTSIDRTKLYGLGEALTLVKGSSYTKFNASVDIAVNLGLDPKQADQNIRGATALPFGLGKEKRIVVFAKGQKAVEAGKEAVEFVGGDDLAEKISAGWLDFDCVVATPDMMGVVGKLGRVLGPRGLMPNPKLGTVTFDVIQAIKELKAGRAEYRVDKAGIVHTTVGRVGMEQAALEGNIKAVMESLVKAKPSTARGTYVKKISISATMGPGVKVDTAEFK